jgi:hypothetical protein
MTLRNVWASRLRRGLLAALLAAIPAQTAWSQTAAWSQIDDAGGVRQVPGRAVYEKIPVTAEGLDLGRPRLFPIRRAEVDVFDRATGEVVFTTGTDETGRFTAEVPRSGDYGLRILSRSPQSGIVVADNTDSWRIYSVEADVPPEGPAVLLARDSDRTSGAFNILEVLGQADDFLRALDATVAPPALTVFWSPRNRPEPGNVLEGRIGGTYFDAGSGVAFVLGDRSIDSDEFDDAVLLHEYAHLLAQRFSRDDSIGGPHLPGDVLDPRVAWSEGWANFFSSLVRDDPIYRDSFDLGGSAILQYDLEDNHPPYPGAGYRGEASVHRLLWDLFDGDVDSGDNVQIAPGPIWQAFRSLAQESFVYLPDFLDALSRVVPSEIPAIEQTAWAHFIDYVHAAEPAVLNAFPRVASGGAVNGEVDSWSRRRANLAQSAHLYRFHTSGGAVSLELSVTGLGPGGNSLANDLDLILMDAGGRVLARADRGRSGQPERMLAFLPGGTYVVEIRSFYRAEGADGFSFNSGSYRLSIQGP